MLRQLPRLRVVRRGSKHGEDEGDAAADGLGAVELGGVAEPELFSTEGVLPAGDGGAVQEDRDALSGGEDSADGGVVGGDGDEGLWREARGGGEGGGAVGAADHFFSSSLRRKGLDCGRVDV